MKQATTQATKQVLDLDFSGVDGNAFALMGYFSREARKAGWTKEQIDEVLKECRSGDYDHLLQTLLGV